MLNRVTELPEKDRDLIAEYIINNEISKETEILLTTKLNNVKPTYENVRTIENASEMNTVDCNNVTTFSFCLIQHLYDNDPVNMHLFLRDLLSKDQLATVINEFRLAKDYASELYNDSSKISAVIKSDNIEYINKIRSELYKYYYIDTTNPPVNTNGNYTEVPPANEEIPKVPDTTVNGSDINYEPSPSVPENTIDNEKLSQGDKQIVFNSLLKNFSRDYMLLGQCPLAAIYLIKHPTNGNLQLAFLRSLGSALQMTDLSFKSLEEFFNIYNNSNTVLAEPVINNLTGEVTSEAVPLNRVCKTIMLQMDNTLVEVTENNVSTLDEAIEKNPQQLSYAEIAQIAADNAISDYASNETDATLKIYQLMDDVSNAINQQKKEAVANEALKQEIEKKQEAIKKLLANTENMQKYQDKLEEQLKAATDLNVLYRSQINSDYVRSKSKADTEEISAFAKEFNLESQPGYTTRASQAIAGVHYLPTESVQQHHVILPYNA